MENFKKDNLLYVDEKIKLDSEQLGNDTGRIAAYELMVSVNKFLNKLK